jgi:hypothetical protein
MTTRSDRLARPREAEDVVVLVAGDLAVQGELFEVGGQRQGSVAAQPAVEGVPGSGGAGRPDVERPVRLVSVPPYSRQKSSLSRYGQYGLSWS